MAPFTHNPHAFSQAPPNSKRRSSTLISLISSSSSGSPDSTTPDALPPINLPQSAARSSNLNLTNPIKPPRRSLQLLNPSASPYVALTPSLVSPEHHHLHPSNQSRRFQSISTPFTLSHLSSPALVPLSSSPSSSSSSSSSSSPPPPSSSLASSSSPSNRFPKQTSSSRPISITPSPLSPSSISLSTSQHTLRTLTGGRYYDEYDEDDDTTISNQTPPIPTRMPPPLQNPCQASFPPSSSSNPSYLARPQIHAVKSHIVDLSSSSHISSPPSKTTKRHSSLTAPLADLPFGRHLSPSSTPSDRTSRSFNLFSIQDWQRLSEERPLLGFCLRVLGLVLGCGLIIAGLVWTLLPPIDEKDLHILRIPTSFEALKKLNTLLQIYKTENYGRVLSSFVLIYLFLQTFSLPGSMYLSILAGAMFGVQVALPLVCLCVATGAMLCYLMSYKLASALVLQLPSLRTRLDEWKIKLSTKTNQLDLFAYLVVVRISPLPPHWAVNLLAPHVGIRPGVFWLTTFLGILPVTLIHTQLGTTLDQMVGPEDLSFLNTKNLTGLALVAVGVMVPVLIRWYLKDQSQDQEFEHGPSNTIESRPFSARIGFSLEDDDDEYSSRPNRLRSLSGHTYERIPTHNSSITSLSKLDRSDSNETLLLSSSHLNTHSSPQTETGRLTTLKTSIPVKATNHHHHHHRQVSKDKTNRKLVHPQITSTTTMTPTTTTTNDYHHHTKRLMTRNKELDDVAHDSLRLDDEDEELHMKTNFTSLHHNSISKLHHKFPITATPTATATAPTPATTIHHHHPNTKL